MVHTSGSRSIKKCVDDNVKLNRICKAKWAKPFNPPLSLPPLPPSPPLSLSLQEAWAPKLARSRSAAERCMFSEKLYIGWCMQLTGTLYVLYAGVCHDTGLWPFVLWTLLSCVRINGCVSALILKQSRSFYYFRGCVCSDFRVYSGVGVVGVQLTKYSLDVMREYGRRGEPCNWSQACVKHACIGRQRLSLASALLLPDRTREMVLWEFPSSRNRFPSTVLVMPKDCFSKIPLSLWTTHLHVTCWYTSALFEGAPNKFWEISP